MGQTLTFNCFKCGRDSDFSKPQDETVMRMEQEAGDVELKFFCQHCATLNEIKLTEESIKMILGSYFAKGGDIGGLIDIFKNKKW